MKIVFMGTPAFAVASLDALVKQGHDIVGVITAPDKPAGRGQSIKESVVKKYAVANGLKVLQPIKLKDPEFLRELSTINPDLQVVVAFRMLPEVVWSMPKLGTINLHASLLPNYRGAAPINHVLINGEKETGVTTFFLQHDIDTGAVLFSDSISVEPTETAGSLHDKLMTVGADLLVRTVNAIESGNYSAVPQAVLSDAKHAPKLSKEYCRIDWNEPVSKIDQFIRGLSPYPAAYTSLNGKQLKIYAGTKEKTYPEIAPGEYHTDGKTFLKFAGDDGYIFVTSVQLEGKKRMSVEELLRGLRL